MASTRVSSVWSVRGIQGGGHLKVPRDHKNNFGDSEVVFGKGCFREVPGWCSQGMVVPLLCWLRQIGVNSTFLEFSGSEDFDVAGSA